MEGDPEQLQPKPYSECPVCRRPMYNEKSGIPGKEKKSWFSEYGWIAALLIVIVVIFSIIGAFIMTNPLSIEPQNGTTTYSADVIIADGGHFVYDLGWTFSGEMEVLFNISSKNGERFDVYIMDDYEYYNAYPYDNHTILSFSAHHAVENVKEIIDTVNLPGDRHFYFVIDNKDTALTPDDATPTGIITVEVYLEIENQYNMYYD